MLVKSSLTCIMRHVGVKISIYDVLIFRKCIESMYFYSCPSLPLKTLGRIFRKSLSPKAKGVEAAMIFFVKISLFIFCVICNFSKCDGFIVL